MKKTTTKNNNEQYESYVVSELLLVSDGAEVSLDITIHSAIKHEICNANQTIRAGSACR